LTRGSEASFKIPRPIGYRVGLKEEEILLNTYAIRIHRPRPCLLVRVLAEVGVEGKKDSNNLVFPMGILRGSHRKVPIGKASGKI